MIGKILNSSKAASTLEYDLGATKRKDQKIRIVYSEGLFLAPELVFVLNKNWVSDKDKKAFKQAAQQLKKVLAGQYESVAAINDRVKYEVGHIALSYSPDDRQQLENNPGLRVEIARKYLKKMEIVNTPFIIISHFGTNAPHDHIAYCRVRFDGSCISGKYSHIRSVLISRELTKEYKLCQGGEAPKAEVSPADFWSPVRIQVREAVAKCADFDELSSTLDDMGIELRIVEKGGRKGVSFRKGKHKISGYKLDRNLTYAKLSEKLSENLAARKFEDASNLNSQIGEEDTSFDFVAALNGGIEEQEQTPQMDLSFDFVGALNSGGETQWRNELQAAEYATLEKVYTLLMNTDDLLSFCSEMGELQIGFDPIKGDDGRVVDFLFNQPRSERQRKVSEIMSDKVPDMISHWEDLKQKESLKDLLKKICSALDEEYQKNAPRMPISIRPTDNGGYAVSYKDRNGKVFNKKIGADLVMDGIVFEDINGKLKIAKEQEVKGRRIK